MTVDINKLKEEGFKPVTSGWSGLANDDVYKKNELIHKIINSIKSFTEDEKSVLLRLSWEHHVGHHWSVGYGDTQYVMTALNLSRKKADMLIMTILKLLDKQYGY